MSSTDTSMIESAVSQAGKPIIEIFSQIVAYAAVIAVIGIAFMAVKYLIVKSLKKGKEEEKQQKSNEVMYCLEPDQLELVRLYMKVSEEDQKHIIEELKTMKRVKK